MIDCDSIESYQALLIVIKDKQIPVHVDYATRNGRHVITEAFNSEYVKWCNVEVKKDDLIFIG